MFDFTVLYLTKQNQTKPNQTKPFNGVQRAGRRERAFRAAGDR